MFTIAAVERDTRLGKDTLRVWERRYGFPRPLRDDNGERLYPPEQVEQLRHIRRLIDAGWRPGRIVGLPLEELLRVGQTADQEGAPRTEPTLAAEPQALYALVRAHDVVALRRALMQMLLRRGLAHFISGVALPLLAEIGEAWSRGQLEVFEEHLCSEAIETVLRTAIATTPEMRADGSPRVLLTTFPGELHGLGLLMAEALFTLEGASCMNLGCQTPLPDIVAAAQAHRADIVALGFSMVSPSAASLDHLAELRHRLPPDIALWAGTPQTAMLRRGVEGVRLLAELADIHTGLVLWRERDMAAPSA
jgi:DNA-binding transcriptional MerR regulator/methylmalonyl-CoA mutase cobalamin-binding subunit